MLFDQSMVSFQWKSFYLFFLCHFPLMETTDPVRSSSNNRTSLHLCYTCHESLIGYTNYADSCKYLNISSPNVASLIQSCPSSSPTGEYECRKVVISYRSVETYLRRDCVRKGQCSWKDRTQSMINTPVSNCVYTDERSHKLECIYCCDTPLCNRTSSNSFSSILVGFLFFFHQLLFSR